MLAEVKFLLDWKGIANCEANRGLEADEAVVFRYLISYFGEASHLVGHVKVISRFFFFAGERGIVGAGKRVTGN